MIESQNKLTLCGLQYLPSLRSTASSIFIILLITLFWRGLTFTATTSTGYDENIYCFYAHTLGEQGWNGLRGLVHEWPTNDILNKAPSPYRIFFIVPAMWTCKLFNGYTVANITLLSSFFSILLIIVTLCLARRWFGPLYGFLITLLMVFSPLAGGLARRGLQDTCFAFVVI